MIADLQPTDANHKSLDFFGKEALSITFDGSFCRKLGPVNTPGGQMVEFEVTSARNNCFDLQKGFIEAKCEITQSSGADIE